MNPRHLRPPAVADQCEHLGIELDAATSAADPSPGNFCHRAAPPASVRLAHQQQYCQTDVHVQCVVFKAQKTGPLPADLRGMLPADPTRRPVGVLIPALLVALAATIGLAGFLGVPPMLQAESPQLSSDVDPAATVTAAPGSAASTAAAPSGALLPLIAPVAATIAVPTDSPSIGVVVEGSPSAVPPNPTVAKACGHQLEEQFGVGRKFVIHRAQPGESLEEYAATYRTSPEAIQGVNAQVVAPLRPDQIIVIPVNQQAIDEVPLFDAYQLWERDTTVGKIASMLRATNLNEFLLYNAISTTCPRFSGWVLVPRERPAP